MRILSFLLIFLFLTGCTIFFPQPKQPVLQDQQAFCLAFEEFQENHRTDGLQKLQVDFPDSVWASRAETIILYAQELDQRKTQIKKLRATEKLQDLELEQLREQNQQLAEKIEQLKALLIQSEAHPK